jgi:hypothetical protein
MAFNGARCRWAAYVRARSALIIGARGHATARRHGGDEPSAFRTPGCRSSAAVRSCADPPERVPHDNHVDSRWRPSYARLHAQGGARARPRLTSRAAPSPAAARPAPVPPLGTGMALNLGNAAHRVYNTPKFNQQAIAGVLYGAPSMLPDLRLNQLAEMRFQALVRALLVCSHQPRIPRHIGGEDRGEPAGPAHVVSPIARRRPERNSSRSSGWRQGRSLGTI